MRACRFLFLALVLLGVVEVYLYIAHPETHQSFKWIVNYPEYKINFALEYPVYVWLIAPAVVIVALAFLHMAFYGMKNYFQNRALYKDVKSLLKLAKARMIQEYADVDIRTRELAEVAKILNNSELNVTKSNTDDEISDVDLVAAIKNGEYVDERELRLSETNPLYRINQLNRLKVDANFALNVLQRQSKYDDEMIKLAYFKAIEAHPIDVIKKIIDGMGLDKEMVKALLKKDAYSDEENRLDATQIDEYLRKYDFDAKDFVEIVKYYKEAGNIPQSFIAMFEALANDKEEAIEAYLYILAEFEMIDQLREVLENTAKDDFVAYKALIDLKDSGKNYTIDSIAYCTTC